MYSPRWPFAQTIWRIEFPFSSRMSAMAVSPCFTTNDWTSSRSPYLAASRRSSLSSSVSDRDMDGGAVMDHMARSKFSLLPHDQIDLVWVSYRSPFKTKSPPSLIMNRSVKVFLMLLGAIDVISSFWRPR